MVPPVPIPNTVVKHSEAESTCLETGWEDRKLPVKQGLRCGGAFFVPIISGLLEKPLSLFIVKGAFAYAGDVISMTVAACQHAQNLSAGIVNLAQRRHTRLDFGTDVLC